MSGASLPVSFSTLFLKENIYLLYCVTDQISLSGCLCLMRYWAICVLKLFVNQVVKLGILKQPYLSNQVAFFYMNKHSRQNLNILKTKRTFIGKRKKFSTQNLNNVRV